MENKVIIYFLLVLLLFLTNNILADVQDKDIFVEQIIKISLDENPSTGYTWHYEIENQDVLKFVKDDFEKSDSATGKIGSRGVRMMYFHGIKEGNTKIYFHLYRDKEEEIIETITYNINIKALDLTVMKHQLFTIELYEKPSTGYKWHIIKNDDVVVLYDERYKNDSIEKSRVGATEIRRWHIFAENPGLTSIEFELYRQEDSIVESKEYYIMICDYE